MMDADGGIGEGDVGVAYDDVCIPKPHFVEACKRKNAEK